MNNNLRTLLFISPFTQFNTPYPAAAQLAGFLKQQGLHADTCDLSLTVLLEIFSKKGLESLFSEIRKMPDHNEPVKRACELSEQYIKTIVPVIRFLQGKDPNLAYRIVKGDLLPQLMGAGGHETDELAGFGFMGIHDKAKYYCSQMLTDLTNLIRESVSPHFGLSRYAEKLAVNLKRFDPVIAELEKEDDFVRKIISEKTREAIERYKPGLVGYTIPFPGNLLGALCSARCIKREFPSIPVVFGGGYVNTELRNLKDKRLFDFADYLTYDDGELPLLNIINNLTGNNEKQYVRTMMAVEGKIIFKDNAENKNAAHRDLPAPYVNQEETGNYISFLDLLNPMHRLWSDGYWNKLTAAHGCYWNKCTFCDTSLDYIKRYSPGSASKVVDWMQEMVSITGRTSFHFTDEAAPPALLRDIALEILRRGLIVTWWGNIRFEKSFTAGLCRLLSLSGCIAVSGGLEAADERVLKLINKGVTLRQAANVCRNFKQAGIMVHAYLMYGFPTQTEQEIINSLELVRQFINLGLFQSAYWHLFSLTVHSPIACDPEKYRICITDSLEHPFANNDLLYRNLAEIDYSLYTDGLNNALYNYMRGSGLNENVRRWFSFRVPAPEAGRDLISGYLENDELNDWPDKALVIWDAGPALISPGSAAGKSYICVNSPVLIAEWEAEDNIAAWIRNISECCAANAEGQYSFFQLKESFPGSSEKFREFCNSDLWKELCGNILIVV
ncbi:MAG: B12-binding domain-containing radical SAM protein [Syntrophothermus sp.]